MPRGGGGGDRLAKLGMERKLGGESNHHHNNNNNNNRHTHTFPQHHGSRKILDRLLDDVGQHPHHGARLLLGEALGAKPLHELQRVEMVVARAGGGRREEACGEGVAP